MKRLLIALVAAVAVSTGFARIVDTQGFETDRSAFVSDGAAGDDASGLVAYPDESAMPTNAAPYNFSDYGSKYFELDTGNATLWYTNECSAPYFDMVMQFNPSASEPDLDGETKIAVYVNANSNLVVKAGDGQNPVGKITDQTDVQLSPGQWARLTIAANGGKFFVRINDALVNNDGYYPLTGDDTATIESVGFKGSGALDDFVARTTDPFIQDPAATIGGEGYASYTDALKEALKYKTSSETLTITANATTMDGTAAKPYQIATADDLVALANAVDANAAVRSLNFVQTANIDMASAGPFAGIGTYAANLNSGVPFMGTYDGAGFKISNVDFKQRNYGGIFNQVKGGTIKNLTVENITCSLFSTGEWGCAIVGNAGLGAKLIGLTAMGSFGTAEKPCTHNVAGIVTRVCGGASNVVAGVTMLETLVQSCTNNATLYGSYTKVAGIAALTQDQNGVPNDYVLFDDCVNNVNIAMVAGKGTEGRDGLSGILGYVADGTKIRNCVNNGTLTSVLGTAKIGGIVGWAQGRFLEDLGGNSAASDKVMIGSYADSYKDGNLSAHCEVTGFQYATVDNGVATTIAPPYTLAADNTYLLEGNVAASETPVFMFGSAGTIAFNTNGYTFAGSVAVSNPNMLDVETATAGETVTFTAVGGTAVASITKDETTTQYNTLAKALAAAESGDTVTLLANNTAAFSIPAGVTVDCSEFANTGAIGGAGTIKVNASPAENLPTFADWVGTYQVAWNPGSSNARINFNDLGNANSKVEILGVNGAFIALPSTNWGTSDGSTPTIQPELVITASWSINNGWDSQTTTINKLSGTGELVVNGSDLGTTPIPYAVNTIDGFSGTLKGTRSKYTLGNIVYENPAFGDCLVKIESTFDPILDSTTLNGNTANLAFGTIDGQKGVYMAAASATVGGAAVYYASIDDALAAADAAYVDSVTVYDIASATNDKTNWSYENGVYTSTREIAKIGETTYTSLAKAIAAAVESESDEVTLVDATSEAVTIPAGLTVAVADDVVFSGTLSGAGAIKYTKPPASFVKSKLLTAGWTGAFVADYDITADANFNMNAYGQSGSTFEIAEDRTLEGFINNGTKGATVTVLPALKVSGTAIFNNGYNDRTNVFSKVTGAGTLTFPGRNSNGHCYVIDSLEDWDGTLEIGKNVTSYQYTYINSILSGTGTVSYAYKPVVLPSVGGGYEGEVKLDFDFNKERVANYGGANSTIVLGSMTGYISDGDGNGTGSIPSKVIVDGNVTINNGWTLSQLNWSSEKVVKMAECKVDLSFTLDSTTAQFGTALSYCWIQSLDATGNGSITIADGFGLRIDAVDFATAPSGDDALVDLTLGSLNLLTVGSRLYGPNGVQNEAIPVTVEGVPNGQKLVYATKSETAGLYLAIAQVGANCYATLAEAMAAADDASITTVTKLADTEESIPSGWKVDTVSGNYVKIAYVAQIGQDGAKYESVVAALEAAGAGDTVRLLANTYERVAATVNNNVTLDINGMTMTSPVDDVIVKNGTGTLTIQDTAVTPGLVQSTINGVDQGVAVWVREGSVVIKSGVFENNSNYEATVYVSKGASCTIEGGTFRNVATGAYHWKTTWAPITLNVQNGHASGSAAIRVSGGSFTTNPANGDDSFGGTFLASGYKATESAGVWTVSEDTGTPLEPGQKSTEYDTAEAATNAMAIVEVAVPSDVDSALDAGEKADYVAMFEKKVVENGDGTYSVAVEMKDEVVAEVQTAVDAATATTLEEVLDVEAGADANVSVTTKPGLYYAIAVGTSLPLTAPASEAYEMATDTTKTLKVTKPTTGTAAFFRVYCSETK